MTVTELLGRVPESLGRSFLPWRYRADLSPMKAQAGTVRELDKYRISVTFDRRHECVPLFPVRSSERPDSPGLPLRLRKVPVDQSRNLVPHPLRAIVVHSGEDHVDGIQTADYGVRSAAVQLPFPGISNLARVSLCYHFCYSFLPRGDWIRGDRSRQGSRFPRFSFFLLRPALRDLIKCAFRDAPDPTQFHPADLPRAQPFP